MPATTALEALIKKAEEVAARGGKPFATNVRPKAKPGDLNFVGPVEPIGPRQITPETFIGPVERQGPQLPFRTNVRLKAPSEPGTGFTMVDTPGQGFTMSPPSRAMAMRDIGSEAAGSPGTALTTTGSFGRSGPQPRLSDIWDAEFREIPRPSTLGPVSAADELAFRTVRPQTLSREELLAMRGPEQAAMSAGTPRSGSYLPIFAGSVLGGTALLSGGQQAQDRMRREADQQAAIETARKMTDFDQSAPNTFSPEEAIRIASVRPEFNQSWSNQVPARSAAPPVQQRSAPPVPMRRPEGLGEQPGGLARLFSDPYAGKSARDLYAEANKMQSSGDEYGSNLLMQRAGKMITKPEDLESTGMATGGAAKPHKDAALHKALDIISHMLGRQ